MAENLVPLRFSYFFLTGNNCSWINRVIVFLKLNYVQIARGVAFAAKGENPSANPFGSGIARLGFMQTYIVYINYEVEI